MNAVLKTDPTSGSEALFLGEARGPRFSPEQDKPLPQTELPTSKRQNRSLTCQEIAFPPSLRGGGLGPQTTGWTTHVTSSSPSYPWVSHNY